MTKKSDQKGADKSGLLCACQTMEQLSDIFGWAFYRKHGLNLLHLR